MSNVQFWLATVSRHGSADHLVDGPHSERDGAEQAYTLIKRLGLSRGDARYVIAKVEISEITGEHSPVNEDAIKTLNGIGLK